MTRRKSMGERGPPDPCNVIFFFSAPHLKKKWKKLNTKERKFNFSSLNQIPSAPKC
jgi:hypothetical protein